MTLRGGRWAAALHLRRAARRAVPRLQPQTHGDLLLPLGRTVRPTQLARITGRGPHRQEITHLANIGPVPFSAPTSESLAPVRTFGYSRCAADAGQLVGGSHPTRLGRCPTGLRVMLRSDYDRFSLVSIRSLEGRDIQSGFLLQASGERFVILAPLRPLVTAARRAAGRPVCGL